MREVTWFLNYCSADPDTTIQYTQSDMVLWAAIDASYLSESNARSHAGATFFLCPQPTHPDQAPNTQPTINGTIYALAKIIDTIMSSAMELEFGTNFPTAKEAIPIRIALEELGHPQPPMPMQVDNTTAIGFCNKKIKHRRSKAIDMQFHWIKDREKQIHFVIHWAPSEHNPADYITKHHTASHHIKMRPQFFRTQQLANIVISQLLQGCDNCPKSRVLQACAITSTYPKLCLSRECTITSFQPLIQRYDCYHGCTNPNSIRIRIRRLFLAYDIIFMNHGPD